MRKSHIPALALSAVLTALALPAMSDDAPPPCGLYLYLAEITRVIDGDTIVADIDLGFRTWLHDEHLRLYGIDAPELNEPGGEAAKEALTARIEGQTLYICTVRMKTLDREATGSFGRYLAEVYEAGESVNDWLVASGHAEAHE